MNLSASRFFEARIVADTCRNLTFVAELVAVLAGACDGEVWREEELLSCCFHFDGLLSNNASNELGLEGLRDEEVRS